jgi:hypothetical protein
MRRGRYHLRSEGGLRVQTKRCGQGGNDAITGDNNDDYAEGGPAIALVLVVAF